MSASLLNLAAIPGAAGQPGAAAGIAQQAAHAAQAQGPLAGFEALLAAFFGDQGLAAQAGAGGAAAQGPLALLVAGAKTADSKTAKAAGDAAKADADKTDSDKADADKAAGALAQGAAANAAEAAALALIAPQAAGQTPAQPKAAGGDAEASGSPDATQPGKSGAQAVVAQLAAAAAAADAKAAKGLKVAAQATAQTASPTTPDSTQADGGKSSQRAPGKAAATAQLQAPLLSNQPAAVNAQALQAPGQAVAAQAKAAQPTAPQTKDKGEAIKAARIEGAPTGPAPAAAAAGKAAETVQAAADTAGKDAGANERDSGTAAPLDAKVTAEDTSQPAGGFNTALNAQAATNASALAHAQALVRGAPQTVANLAAQIAKKLDGRSTRFDVQLDPAGLGKVDVRVEIDAAGKMTAALNFDNQQAANELRSRAGELQRAMEQAGFDLSGGLSFDIAGQGGQAQGQQDGAQPAFRGRAFQAVLDGGADAAVTPQTSYRAASAGGVDIRI